MRSELEFLGLGAAFCPEHHPEDTWPAYVRLIKEAGLKFVRMAEFTWNLMEPEEGRYDFEWLDRALYLLERAGLKAILCTPTAAPPVWASEKYPEINPVLRDGRTKGFGGRRYTCPSSVDYVRLCRKIAEKMAAKYASDPRVIGWQIDNELGDPFCFCPRCKAGFATWLEERFGTVAAFNAACSMQYWGQTVARFDQVPLPNAYDHPSLWLAYHNFLSDATIACYRPQADALRRAGVAVPITTNMMCTWYGYDHEKFGRMLDVIAVDHYFGNDSTFSDEACYAALFRSFRNNAPFWINETTCSRIGDNWPLPGLVRLYTLVNVGLGVNRLDYFRFDTCPSGNERDIYGMLKPCAEPGRIYREIGETARRLEKIRPLLADSVPKRAKVAFLYTFDNHYEFAETPKYDEFRGRFGNGYFDAIKRRMKAVADMNVPVDIVHAESDFSKYNFIVGVGTYVLPEKLGAKIADYVAGGGNFLLLPFSGVVDENAKMHYVAPPGPLYDVFGVQVLDNGPLCARAGEVRFRPAGHLKIDDFAITGWIEEIVPDADVQIFGTYGNQFFEDVAALTVKKHGAGHAYYLGFFPAPGDWKALIARLLERHGIQSALTLPDGVHVSIRTSGAADVCFISNETNRPVAIGIEDDWLDAETGTPAERPLDIEPLDVRILKRPGGAGRPAHGG